MWLGFVFGALCLGIFAHDADWQHIAHALKRADPGMIAFASIFLLMTMVGRAWRWRVLLGLEGVRFRHRLTSTAIGFAGNNALPGRLGEPLRCLVISRLDPRVSFGRAAGSIVVERVLDLGAALIALLAFVVIAPFAPEAATRQAAWLARLESFGGMLAAAVVLAAVILFVMARRRFEVRRGWWTRVLAIVASVQEGFGSLRSARAVLASFGFTAVVWGSMLTYDFLMLRAFGFDELGVAHALGLLVVLSFAIALPQAPAGVGVVQLASQTTLAGLYGMPLASAKAFAIAQWACQVGVVISAGVTAAWLEGLSMAVVRDVERTRNDDEQRVITAN